MIDLLSDQFILRGVPEHIRSDNGPEFVARSVQDWIGAVGAKRAYFERGSIPGRTASSKASTPGFARDQLIDGEIFHSLAEARIVIESRRRHYKHRRGRTDLWATSRDPCLFNSLCCGSMLGDIMEKVRQKISF